MAHEEEQRRSRVVVETPTARREYEQTQRAYVPERSGISTGTVALVVLAAVAMTAIVMLFVMNPSEPENTNVRINTATQPTPLAPAGYATPLPPPPTVTEPATTVVVPPTATVPPVVTAPAVTEPAASPTGPDPARLQADLNRALLEDRELSAAGASITGTVTNSRAVLSGTVNSERLKNRARQVALTVPGIRQVDITQITVIGDDTAPPPPATSPQ
jgi:hypothetical protein